jgi:pimeloyl-ACP methyl ester carboxylesterase
LVDDADAARGRVMHEQRTIRTEIASAGDIEIAYQVLGSGHPLLLIIGLGAVKELWTRDFLEGLARDFKVIAFDNRGMGQSSRGWMDFSITQFAADSVALLDSLAIESAHVAGYSMGGYVAQEVALSWPDRVDRLVLLGTECGGAEGIRQEPGILLELTGSQSDDDVDLETSRSFFLSRDWLESNSTSIGNLFGTVDEAADAGVLGLQAQAVREWNGTCSLLPEVDKETLVVTGTDDIVILPENARVLSELIPRAELVEVVGGNHGLVLQFPLELAGIVTDFLKA